jgi:hypothetical protein
VTAQISVNGVNLDQLLAQGVEGSAGLRKVPGKRGSNIDVPNRHGQLHVAGKRYQAAACLLPMWVRGVNPDGSVPSDPGGRLLFEQRLRELVALFTCGELVTLRHTLTDGSAREITGEVVDVLDPSVDGIGRDTLGQVNVGLTCADPFWTDIVNSSATVTLAAGATRMLAEFGDATAPMEDLLINFGPGTNLVLTQVETGAFLAYDGPITSGRHLAVDTSAFTVVGTVDTGGTWNPSTAPTQHLQRIRHGRHPRLFQLAPTRPNPPTLRNDSTGTLTVTITGRQRHLVP